MIEYIQSALLIISGIFIIISAIGLLKVGKNSKNVVYARIHIAGLFDVAFNRILGGNIDPIVVDIETVLERPVSQTILVNSISLTPGTLSVDLDSENNIIKVAAISPRKKEDIIPFEKYIKKMLE